mmetsp:Transcript_104557/g.202652  ORF Transcript_104557/g.202652 Transcript_104557/m.202652 type:complete len:450 (-) Transcript_104557:64-1413(-)|eukprot:CAMPEP_0172728564 /NCGR_PEP_ID=MMETSP1074-20121228/92311_1 /TAXON_ID=2916 /ORGANISM="Ceratium fusus, Strain PA161109" /LENGTH=449 /DNA_ID=CAMNT_0013555827 /DNA_START=81 /DNA_END=1430 /DNA_ORIENTATION=-
MSAKGVPPPKGAGKGKAPDGVKGGPTYKEQKEAELTAKEDQLSAEAGFKGKDSLTAEESRIIEEKHTEEAGSGEYEKFSPKRGYFACRKCGNPVYSFQAKFDSGCGWPAFDKCYAGSIVTRPETDGTGRVEITCAQCGGHLGHVFVEVGNVGVRSDQRHCANSMALQYVKHEPPDNVAEEVILELPAPVSAVAGATPNGNNSDRGSLQAKLLLETQGDGATFPQVGDSVAIHYTGTLLVSDAQFDTSRDGDPFEFEVGAGTVIKGWDEGIRQLPLGALGHLMVPAALGYGERGMPGTIPPNSDLVFEVELISINGKKVSKDSRPDEPTGAGLLHRGLSARLRPAVVGLLRDRPVDPLRYLHTQLQGAGSTTEDSSPALAIAVRPEDYVTRVQPLLTEMVAAVHNSGMAQHQDKALEIMLSWLEQNAGRRLPDTAASSSEAAAAEQSVNG